MNKKTVKPNLDLITAKFSIFAILAIIFTISSVHGLPSWFLWLVLLLVVFSIFSAAIEAEDDVEAVNKLADIILTHQEKIKTELNEYKAVAENLDEMYVQEKQKNSELQKRVDQLEVSEFTLAKVKLILKNNPNLIESELKKLIEQELNMDQYISHRKKAEEVIAKGASLTMHKVDL